MKTGFKNLDEKVELNKGNLMVIASRPAMGKTTLALNILSHIALEDKKNVLFISLENNEENIINRLVISNSMVETKKLDLYNKHKNKEIQNLNLSEDDLDRIQYGIKLLKNSPIYIMSDAPYSIKDISEKSRKLKEEKNIELIIIDYLQLIQFDKNKILNRSKEMTEILKNLKILAKTLDVPVIVTSQLSKECEKRENKRPMMSDFSDSKYGIYTYSDEVLFIYRDSYYNKENKSNMAEIIVAKNRSGNTGKVILGWMPEYLKFGNTITSDLEHDVFNVKSNLNIDEYCCKRQVKTKLNKKLEIKDNYNLINSKAISDYCRSIKHKFNTEELAVLVYRNKRMDIGEKIEKYKDLIKNYPDMEVIERINCKHYDSIKTMIKNEINRLENLYYKFISKNEDCIYTWIEYNKSTLQYDYRNTIENTKRTFEEAYKDVCEYVKEYNDTISFEIIMKNFNNSENNITAFYVIENKAIKLINLIENKNNFLGIDNIFLNIPTPFKKGDILISNSKCKNYGDFGEIFVLDYLSTWRDGLDELLKKGNYDSSDMIGYGYYLYGEDSTEIVLDNKWDYDSFEYYDGELTGKNRILKDISSFIKGKIGLELFIHAYDFYKTEHKNEMPNFYTDEALKLAGMSDEDIEKINHKSNKENIL